MNALLALPLVFTAATYADEAADRDAIRLVLDALNKSADRTELFATDFDAAPVLERAMSRGARVYVIAMEPGDNLPSVTISHEPWGEATINWPGMATVRVADAETLKPKIVTRAIRFIVPDVALVDAACVFELDGAPPRRLFIVMKREAGGWKIASARAVTRP